MLVCVKDGEWYLMCVMIQFNEDEYVECLIYWEDQLIVNYIQQMLYFVDIWG